MSFEELIAGFAHVPRRSKTLLVGMDGCGGSGKSTFAKKLQLISSDLTVIHMDDFYLPTMQRLPREIATKQIGADFDWQRLKSQVLKNLKGDEPGYYQSYDWRTDKMTDWHNVPVGGVVIIEGIYSTRKELLDFYDFKIWIDCPCDLRLERGIKRDGEQARSIWENDWMPAEDSYIKHQRPIDSADLVIDGKGSLDFSHDSFVCLCARNIRLRKI